MFKRRKPNYSADIAFHRLMWITGADRIATMDARVIWYGGYVKAMRRMHGDAIHS